MRFAQGISFYVLADTPFLISPPPHRSQQVVGHASGSAGGKARTSYINHENTLAEFSFPRGASGGAGAAASLAPILASASERGETWLGVNFASVYDGAGAAALRSRVRLRIVVVLDYSGSMAMVRQTGGGGRG